MLLYIEDYILYIALYVYMYDSCIFVEHVVIEGLVEDWQCQRGHPIIIKTFTSLQYFEAISFHRTYLVVTPSSSNNGGSMRLVSKCLGILEYNVVFSISP